MPVPCPANLSGHDSAFGLCGSVYNITKVVVVRRCCKNGGVALHRIKGQLPNLPKLPSAEGLASWLRKYLPGSPPNREKGEPDK